MGEAIGGDTGTRASQANGCGAVGWLAAILVLAVIAIGVAVLGGQSSDRTRRDAGGEESVEFKLSTLDGSIPAGNDDPALVRYQVTLDALETKCTNGRERLADFAVVAKRELAERGVTVSLLEFLRSMNDALPTDLGTTDCTDIAAATVILMAPG